MNTLLLVILNGNLPSNVWVCRDMLCDPGSLEQRCFAGMYQPRCKICMQAALLAVILCHLVSPCVILFESPSTNLLSHCLDGIFFAWLHTLPGKCSPFSSVIADSVKVSPSSSKQCPVWRTPSSSFLLNRFQSARIANPSYHACGPFRKRVVRKL